MSYNPAKTVINFVAHCGKSNEQVVGCAMELNDGWKFIPFIEDGGATVRPRPTLQLALPRWVRQRKLEMVYVTRRNYK